MIPRRIHHIWLGPRPMPEQWPARWVELHPGWETKVWREDDLAALRMRNGVLYRDLIAKGRWVAASDVARLEVLYALGGVYTDIDSIPVRSLDGAYFLDADVAAAYEPIQTALPGRIANGTIAAVPRSEAIDTARKLVGAMRVTDPPWATIGAPALTAALLVHERCCDVRILPSRTFYRKDARGRAVAGDETSYVEHFWSSTNGTYPPRVVVLVPRRAGDPVRDRIWAWCRRIWEQQGWPIFEGHHDEPGLFSASKARNAAAAAAGEWDVAVFADADTVPFDWKPVRDAVTLAHESGHFIRPFTTYHFLDDEGTETFMATGVLPKRTRILGESAYGGIHVVPRRLWDASGGYDERFLGWGSEDAAFQFACTALGGFRRLPGDVYHLSHPMQLRDPSTPQYQANVALGARYRAAMRNRAAMTALLRERDAPVPRRESFALVVTANGRGELLAQTMASIERHVTGIGMTLICDDSGSPAFAEWLRSTFPTAIIDAHRHLGHGPAVARAWQQASDLPVDWVLWVEEDMLFQRDVALADVASVLSVQPVTQMVFKRNAHFPEEVAAGPTVIDRFDPASFAERETGGHAWMEHRLFYSLNPHVVSRAFLRSHRWPARPNSEHHFGRRLFRDAHVKVGMWGTRADPPLVLHAGTSRTGTGY